MAIKIFMGLCMLGDGFLVYVLFHFIQEGRRGQAGRRPFSYQYSPAAGAGARVTRRKVIQITIPPGHTGHTGAGRRVS